LYEIQQKLTKELLNLLQNIIIGLAPGNTQSQQSKGANVAEKN
jgi:hypothetical protein